MDMALTPRSSRVVSHLECALLGLIPLGPRAHPMKPKLEGSHMRAAAIDLMLEQVQTIYHAATGKHLVEAEADDESGTELTLDDMTQRFANLEARVRRDPTLAERVPPFSFSPSIDLVEGEKEWLVTASIPGVNPKDVSVEISEDTLIIAGALHAIPSNGHRTLRAEIPRGPFRRVIKLPGQIQGEVHTEFQNGVALMRIPKPVA
jgi:HSP20 family molecular chaperone IbpA